MACSARCSSRRTRNIRACVRRHAGWSVCAVLVYEPDARGVSCSRPRDNNETRSTVAREHHQPLDDWTCSIAAPNAHRSHVPTNDHGNRRLQRSSTPNPPQANPPTPPKTRVATSAPCAHSEKPPNGASLSREIGRDWARSGEIGRGRASSGGRGDLARLGDGLHGRVDPLLELPIG